MVHSSLPIKDCHMGEPSFSSWSCWGLCVSMKLKVLCLRMRSKIAQTMWGDGQLAGKRCFYSSIKKVKVFLPSSWGMFVYRDMTSTVTKNALVERGVSFSIRLRNCFVFLMCDGRLLTRGLIKCVYRMRDGKLNHQMVTMDWLFLRSFSAFASFNIRLLRFSGVGYLWNLILVQCMWRS